MKARLLGLLYALGGIALAVALTFGAYVLAGGRDLSRPARATQVENDLAPGPTATPDARPDLSGPCDEAEHAGDPRCRPGGDDRPSGEDGRGDDGEDDDNSGPGGGGGDDPDDNSGPGGGDDDGSDDNFGPGDDDDDDSDDSSGSGSDDDNSGSGSDDSGGDD